MQPTQNTAVNPATPAATLRTAGAYLERYGWIQGAYYEATGGSFTPAACMVGAIGMVCYGGPVDAPAQMVDAPGLDEFAAALAWLDGFLSDWYGVDTAYDFNDAKGRTALEVIAALNDAADEYDEHADADFSDCVLCGAPGGYPYCLRGQGGGISCAEVARGEREAGLGLGGVA